jgi:phosphomannomutase/phosphoglucomutase
VDGTFPNHHPDPTKPENVRDLIAAVREHGADVGLGLDGDGDRLGVVTPDGTIIWPDRLLMLWARDVLDRNPGARIIYDIKCSKHVGDAIRRAGGEPVLWKTGHSLIKAKLKETGALLAGEMSGHIFFSERWYGFDDGLYAAARLLEILSRVDRAPAAVFHDLPDSVNTPELNVCMEEGETFTFMERLIQTGDFGDGRLITIDGLRVEFDDGWGLVRSSNTTPCLVIRFEADNAAALARIQGLFRDQLLRTKRDLELPF